MPDGNLRSVVREALGLDNGDLLTQNYTQRILFIQKTLEVFIKLTLKLN